MWFILIVLYKKTLDTSKTLRGVIDACEVINSTNSFVLLWDNSPCSLPNKELQVLTDLFSNFKYLNTPENLPLSSIYNAAITKSINNATQYLVLLDDDSNIDHLFFKEALKNVHSGHQLLLPVIKNGGVIRSPLKYYIIKSFIFSKLSVGAMASKNIMAINSGMIIAVKFLEKYEFRYDDRLQSYGTDNYFMRFYAQKCKVLFIMEYVLDHSLSFFDTDNIQRKIEIFQNIKKANLIVHQVNFWELVLASTFNLLTSVKYALKYRTLKFLK